VVFFSKTVLKSYLPSKNPNNYPHQENFQKPKRPTTYQLNVVFPNFFTKITCLQWDSVYPPQKNFQKSQGPPPLPVNDDYPDIRGRLQKSVFEKIERIGQIVQRVDASVKDSVEKELNLILVRSEIMWNTSIIFSLIML
jgi:hypothetical protein